MIESTIEEQARPWVSEVIDRIARVKACAGLEQARTPADFAVEVLIGEDVRSLSLQDAARLAGALWSALDRVRRARPSVFSDVVPAPAEVELVSKSVEWLKVLLAQGRSLETVTHAAIEQSMLLRRLRSGAPALLEPPPTSHGQPWYSILESDEPVVHQVDTDGRITTLAELIGTGTTSTTALNQFLVKINGCHWNVVQTLAFGSRYLVAYQGHESLFELSSAPDSGGSGSWSLRKLAIAEIL